ncbi:hypothetical protein ACSQ67_018085 [Phaseolus vulgaris]
MTRTQCGEWWKSNIEVVINEALKSGLAPNVSMLTQSMVIQDLSKAVLHKTTRPPIATLHYSGTLSSSLTTLTSMPPKIPPFLLPVSPTLS